MYSMESKSFLRRVILAISLVMGFVFLVSLTVFYIKENYGVAESCTCDIPIYLIIIILSSLGVFVGTFTYYLLTRAFIKDKKTLKSDILKTLDFLNNDEKKIMEAIIHNSGKIPQNRIVELTKIGRVKVSRKLSALERKGILTKEKHGMTNMIILSDYMKNIFLNDSENEYFIF